MKTIDPIKGEELLDLKVAWSEIIYFQLVAKTSPHVAGTYFTVKLVVALSRRGSGIL
jgi:hypothetical protein